jgi:hypothetical protein
MKEKLHHHHKHESHHHKERHHHKMKNKSNKEHEYKSHSMPLREPGHMEHLIGGVVKDNHQEGISRKILRSGDMDVGQHGSMSGGWKHKKMNQELTPRKG